MVITMLSFLLILAGSIVYWASASKGAQGVHTALKGVQGDVEEIVSQADVMNTTGKDVITKLDNFTTLCPSVKDQLADTIKNAKNTFEEIQKLDASLKHLPKDSKDLLDVTTFFVYFLNVALLTPLCLVFIVTVVITSLVCCANTGTCSGCMMRSCSPLLFAPTVLLLSLTSAFQLWAGITTGSFCVNANANELAYAKFYFGENSTEYQLSKYYLDGGNATNPLLQEMDKAQLYVNKMDSDLTTLRPLIAQQCGHDVEKIVSGVDTDLQTFNATISKASNILSQQHMQPYYEAILPEGLCEKFVDGLGWLIIFQVVTGLMCLPCLACAATKYLGRQAQYFRHHEEAHLLQYPEAQMSGGFRP